MGLKKGCFEVIGHRGVAAKYPENTLLSFKTAVELGVDAVEFDVHRTRDGRLVVTHDHTVDRCSNGKGNIKDMTCDQLKALDFGGWKGPEYTGLKIPTFQETLDFIHGMKPDQYLLVELKDDDEGCTRAVLEELRTRGALARTLVLSFHPRQLKLLRELEPKLMLQGFPDRYVKDAIPDAYQYYDKVCIWISELTHEEVASFHARGIKVDTCQIDDAKTLEKVVAFDVDSFTTNASHLILPLLREKGLR